MSKYIINTDTVYGFDIYKSMLLMGTNGRGEVVVQKFNLDELEELNDDYINGHYGSLQDEAYQRGLDDAWEAAWKIMDMDDFSAMDAGLDTAFNLPVTEAIKKLKAYEEKQKADEDVKRGDVVIRIDDGAKYLVTYVGDGRVCGINGDGKWHGANLKNVARTGEHHDIDKIMGELRK